MLRLVILAASAATSVQFEELVSCGRYRLDHGTVSPPGPLVHPRTAVLSCSAGYQLSGPGDSVVKCNSDGTFSVGKVCAPVSCGSLSVVGGVADPRWPIAYGEAVRLTCARGFELAGDGGTERVCGQDGSFSPGLHCAPSERWSTTTARHARADRASDIAIRGEGFLQGAFYECQFQQQCEQEPCATIRATATVRSDTELQCKGVSWGGFSGTFSVGVLKAGLEVPRTDAEPALVQVMPVLLSVKPAKVTALGGELITLRGAGFEPRRCFRCRFRDAHGTEVFSELAEVVNATSVVCRTPTWIGEPLRATVVLVTAPENVMGPACDEPRALTDEVAPFPGGVTDPARLHVDVIDGWSSLTPMCAHSSAKALLRVSGAGFGAAQHYSMHLHGESEVHVLHARCSVLGPGDLECALPHWKWHAQVVTAHLVAGGRRVAGFSSFTFSATVVSLEPSMGALSKGERVTVRGAGFHTGRLYTARFSCNGQNALSPPSAPASADEILFAAPAWRFGACNAAVSIELDDTPLATDAGGPLTFAVLAQWAGVGTARLPCCLGTAELRVLGAFQSVVYKTAHRSLECVWEPLTEPAAVRRTASRVDHSSCDSFTCSALICDAPTWSAPLQAALSLAQDGRVLPVEGGAVSKVEFLEEGWSALSPARAFVDAGATITVSGSGFTDVEPYSLHLKDSAGGGSVAECVRKSSTELACTLARWPVGAAAARAALHRQDYVVAQARPSLTLWLDEYWVGMSLAQSTVEGGDELLFRGNGFSAARNYNCKFEAGGVVQSVRAAFVSGNTLRCATLEWDTADTVRVSLHADERAVSFGCGRHVEIDPAVVPNPTQMLTVLPSWTHTRESVVLVIGGSSSLLVEGRGFGKSAHFSCRLRKLGDSAGEVVSLEAATESPSALRCVMRGWRADEGSLWTLSVLKAGSEVRYSGAKPWLVSYTEREAAPAWELPTAKSSCAGEGDFVVRGRGFVPKHVYTCMLEGEDGEAVQTDAVFVSSVELRCALQAWPGQLTGVTFGLLESGRVLPHSSGSPKWAISFSPAWWFETPQRSRTSGGDTIEVRSCGLDTAAARYRLRLVGTDRAGRSQAVWSEPAAAEGARVAFRAPGWSGLEQAVRAEVFLATGEGDAIPRASRGAPTVQVVGVIVHVEHTSGGLQSGVDGGGRLDMVHTDLVDAPGARFFCRFLGRGGSSVDSTVQFAQDGSTAMSCVVPRWPHGAGDAAVSIISISKEAEVLTRPLAGGPAVLRFVADIGRVHIASVGTDGAVVVAAGRGFGAQPARCLVHACDGGALLGTSVLAPPVNDSAVECLVSRQALVDVPGNALELPARVRVSIVDEEGRPAAVPGDECIAVPAPASPVWELVGATEGPACGGTSVTVRAWGLGGDSSLALRFNFERGFIDVRLLRRAPDADPASSAEVLEFEAPRALSASEVRLNLRSDVRGELASLEEGVRKMIVFSYYEVWSALSVSVGPASGGTVLELQGCGFAPGGEHRCVFTGDDTDPESVEKQGLLSVPARVVNGSTVRCVTPAWAAQWPEAHVSLQRDTRTFVFAGRGSGAVFRFARTWTGLRGDIGERTTRASGGELLHIVGEGFSAGQGRYTCVFSRGAERLSTPAALESATALSCATPAWGAHFAAGVAPVHISISDGTGRRMVDFAGAAPPALRFTAEILGIIPASARAAEPMLFRLAAAGLDPAIPLVCRAVSTDGSVESAPALPKDPALFTCTLPPLSDVAGAARIELLDPAGAPVTTVSALEVVFAASWRSVSANAAGAAGGTTVRILGAGFAKDKRFELKMAAGDPRGGLRARACCEIESTSVLACALPRWTEAAGAVTLTLVDATSGAAVDFAGDAGSDQLDITVEWESVSGPMVGPARGGSAITVHGAGFSSATAYTCEFKAGDHTQHSAPAFPVDSGEFICISPAWTAPAGPCELLVVRHNDGATLARAAALAATVPPPTFVFVSEWAAMEVSLSAVDSVVSLVIRGVGFEARSGFSACVLVDVEGDALPIEVTNEVSGEAPDTSTLRCRVPAAEISASGAARRRVEVRVGGAVATYTGPSGEDILSLHGETLHSGARGAAEAPGVEEGTSVDRPTDSVNFALVDPSVRVSEDSGWTMVVRFARDLSCGAAVPCGAPSFIVTERGDSGLFTKAGFPRVDSAGSLVFELSRDRHGHAEFDIVLSFAALEECSHSRAFTVEAIAVNDPPIFMLGAGSRVVVREDDAAVHPFLLRAFVTGIVSEPFDVAQLVSFQVTPLEPASAAHLFTELPAVSVSGDLSFRTAPDASGEAHFRLIAVDDGGRAEGGSDESDPLLFLVSVDEVNDPPSFRVMPAHAAVRVREDECTFSPCERQGVLLDIAPGPADEAGQPLSFRVEVADDCRKLFAELPEFDAAGSLTFTTVLDAHGVATIRVVLHDGGTPREAASEGQNITVVVSPINDAPSFEIPSRLELLEDASPRTILHGFARNIVAGPSDEDDQMLSFAVSLAPGAPAALFSVPPQLSSDGTLYFELAPDASGTISLDVILRDSGGRVGGGTDASFPARLLILVAPVNDAPSFSLTRPLLVLLEDSPPQRIQGLARNISAGPGEQGQRLSFEVTVQTGADLFAAPPTLSPEGTLMLRSAPDAAGRALLHIVLRDDGWGASGNGANASAPQALEVRIDPVNDRPAFALASRAVAAEARTGEEHEVRAGFVIGVSPGGGPDEAGQRLVFQVSLVGGDARAIAVAPRVEHCHQGACLLSFAVQPGSVGTSRWRVDLSDDGGRQHFGEDRGMPAEFEVCIGAAPLPDTRGTEKRADLPGLRFIDAPVYAEAVTTVQLPTQNERELAPSAGFAAMMPPLPGAKEVDGGVVHHAGRALLQADTADDIEAGAQLTEHIFATEREMQEDAGRQLLQADPLAFRMAVERPCTILPCERSVEGLDNSGLIQCAAGQTRLDPYILLPRPECLLVDPTPCVRNLKIYKDDGCDGAFTWGTTQYEDRFLVIQDVPVAQICCSPDSVAGSFVLENFVLTEAQASEWTMTPTDQAASDWLFTEAPALSQTGRLTFVVSKSRYGQVSFVVTMLVGGQQVSQDLTIDIMQRNQAPRAKLHTEYRVFQNTGENVLPAAAYDISPGSSFSYAVPSVDEEATQALTFTIQIDRPGLFEPEHQPVFALASNKASASLRLKVAAGEFGSTTATVILRDSAGGELRQTVLIIVAAVDEPPTFVLAANVSVVEDAACRAQFGWITGGGDTAWNRKSGCPHEFSGIAAELRAGGPDEVCINCVEHPPCSNPVNCKYQKLSFVLDDVSDPLAFYELPRLDVDGTLRFSLVPDAAGAPRVVFRLVDDGDVWVDATATSRECRSNADPCGPAAAEGVGPSERGYQHVATRRDAHHHRACQQPTSVEVATCPELLIARVGR